MLSGRQKYFKYRQSLLGYSELEMSEEVKFGLDPTHSVDSPDSPNIPVCASHVWGFFM